MRIGLSFAMLQLVAALMMFSCRAQDKCVTPSKEFDVVEEGGRLKRQYVPEYYVYRNGRYRFVKGHYQWILFPKQYVKRSLRGYSYKQANSSGRPRPKS